MIGINGVVVTTPILILFFGMTPAHSVATALLFSAVVKVDSTLVYLIRGQVVRPHCRVHEARGRDGCSG
jgi:uncharacterized membrane protein YfcA